MLRGPIALASFGLVLNLFLWGVPGIVGASGAAHLVLPAEVPGISQALGALGTNPNSSPGIYDALLKLIGAESEALQIAGEALEQPAPSNIAPRANAASTRVEYAVRTYIQAARALVQR
jgi:hypothetical protein